ncbi:MAG: serine/threonine-protein phosphatase, partial [Oscillospiraceae bacterium]|nr:serine/threonine-protein phosphatase [Oscillospiraceae bacterium]
MNIEYIKYSDTGLVRQVNQDRIFAVSGKDCGLYVVADGIGGHFCGEIASSKLINAFDCWWKEFSEEKSEFHRCADELKEIILRINSEIYNEFSAKGKLCGTTVALLFICGGKYVIINIGDSRIYTLRGGKLNKETVDHTILAEAKIRGKQPSKDAKDRLTSAVGCQKELKMSIKTASVRASPFFICSDGVYKYVSGRDIVKFMQKRNLDGAERLCNRIIGNGAGDNYSFILVYAHNNAEEGGCNQRKDIINQPNEKKFLRGSTTMKKSTKIIIPIAVAVIII